MKPLLSKFGTIYIDSYNQLLNKILNLINKYYINNSTNFENEDNFLISTKESNMYNFIAEETSKKINSINSNLKIHTEETIEQLKFKL